MYSFLSDNGSWIVVFDGDEEEPMEMTIQEFVDRYGEENLPARELKPGDVLREDLMPHELSDVLHYWKSFRRLVEACGRYAQALKLDQKDAYGSEDAHKVVQKLYKEGAVTKLAIEIQDRYLNQCACARNLNYWSQRVGFKPMRDADLDILMNHLYGADFRKRMYYRIDKYSKKDVLVSARDLVIDVLKSFRKQNRLP